MVSFWGVRLWALGLVNCLGHTVEYRMGLNSYHGIEA